MASKLKNFFKKKNVKKEEKEKKEVKTVLSKSDLEYYQKILLAEKQRLTSQLKKIGKERPRVGYQGAPGEILSHDNDTTDRATEVSEVEKILALEDNIYRILTKIDSAILKIQSKTYGICDNCGKQIDKERLKVVPHATLCVKCKAKQEKEFI